MQVAINRCYGGFNLSNEAMNKLIEKNSSFLLTYTPKEWFGKNEPNEEQIVDCMKKNSNVGYKDGKIYFFEVHDKYVRIHSDLIDVLQELGPKANGCFSKIKIVNVPDDIEFEIDEYDGMESVEEIHRRWY